MLDGLEEMFRIRAEQKELRLIFERTPDVPRYVVCDEGKLRQVLINLLSNAIKFTPEGGVTLAVEGRKSRTANQAESPGISMLRFVVEDTGVGIAADELPAIFEEFGQTQSGRQSNEGTGLGMSISRAFVRMLGGDIAVESAPGQGSRFSFAIPVGQGDPTRVAPQPSPRTVVALAPDQPVYRILVADDIEENRLVLQQLLTSVGFEVREASNGREVLNLWETWEPHLIWMDMRMPEMDGYEATRRIKATPRGRQTPIIALTASAFEEDRAAMREAGCNDIVAKPFEEPQIFERMAHFLGVRFVYKEEGQRDEAEDATSKLRRTVSLTPATLAALPAEWRAALAQAAEQGDEEQVVILLEQIREPHPDLAAALMTLVHTMYIDQIATLLAEGMAEQPTTGVET
jgi:CheY-like chemotaxis protein